MRPLSYASLRSGMDRRVGNFVYTFSAIQNSMSLSLCRGRPKRCAGSFTPWHNSWSNLRNLNFSLVCAALYSRHFCVYVFFAFLAAIAHPCFLPGDGQTMRLFLAPHASQSRSWSNRPRGCLRNRRGHFFAPSKRLLACPYFGTATFD